jgi:hypothetical protein
VGKNEVNQVPAKAEGKGAAARVVESTRRSRAGGPPARIVIRSLGESQRISFRSGPFLSRNLGCLFAESCTGLSRQMRNRSFSPCSFGRFLNVPLRSGSLFSSCHNLSNQAVRGSRFLSHHNLGYVLNGGAFLCALLSSRRPNAIAQSVASLPASNVSTMPALMPSDDSRV